MNKETETLFQKSRKGVTAYSLPSNNPEFSKFQPKTSSLRTSLVPLPEVSELTITRHFSNLARRNVGIDTHFYPLGSCTMKLNPRVCEEGAALPLFTQTHPLAADRLVQGNLELISHFTKLLCNISGMDAGSLLPNAGAQGEYCGIRLIQKYHASIGETKRTEMLVPDSAHGTNPATAKMCGFDIVTISSAEDGDIDIEELKEKVGNKTAGLMLTNPSTLGLFSSKILEIAKIIHDAGGLLYYDGANLNPILNVARPGDMGFDVMHINLHKTFSTPHGGGGPGSGPICCSEKLSSFLPIPQVHHDKETDSYYSIWEQDESIGHIATFFGNFGIYLRAYLYTIMHGAYGLQRVAYQSTLNANYLKKKVSSFLNVPYKQPCMHEFVVQADRFLDKGIKALDIAKRMIDYGVHPPTIYFPLIVKECFLIEPTESESKETLDEFVEIIERICNEAEKDPQILLDAPHNAILKRLDEVLAVKLLKVKDCVQEVQYGSS